MLRSRAGVVAVHWLVGVALAGKIDREDREIVGEQFSLANLSWVVNAYVLTFGGFLLLGGRIADPHGRRRIFTVGLVVFSLASLAGGLAQNQAWLIAARAIQGLGAALLASAALSLVTATFREGSERNKNSPTGMRVALVSLLMVGCLVLLLCV